jgi:alanyl-tRNA synthetase
LEINLPVAERLYYSDSFLKTFAGTVTSTGEGGRGQGQPLWRMSLNRTAFYPTSGGQPFDTGILRATLPEGPAVEVVVEEVEEDDQGEVWHCVKREVPPGTRVEGHIDWARRFDHMQQHTGQHLLSAVFFEEAKAPTVSFHLGEKSSTIDLAMPSLAQDVVERVERIVNEIIGEDRGIDIRYVSRNEATALLAAGKIRKLPDRQGEIRLIEISNCDLNACGGTHLRSTGQIGGLLVRGVQRMSRGVRVEFVCGLRAVRVAREDSVATSGAAALLSISAQELPIAVERMLQEGKARVKEYQKLRGELAALQAASLVSEESIDNGLRVVTRAWKDRDRDYVKVLALQTAAAGSSTAAIFCAKEAEPMRVFVARSRDLGFDCGRILREELARWGLRGGGSADLAQGDVPAEHERELVGSLKESIRRSLAPSSSES